MIRRPRGLVVVHSINSLYPSLSQEKKNMYSNFATERLRALVLKNQIHYFHQNSPYLTVVWASILEVGYLAVEMLEQIGRMKAV